MSDLVKRLREIDTGQRGWGYAKHAADRIEELEERLEAAENDAKEAEAYAAELESKLAKVIAAWKSADGASEWWAAMHEAIAGLKGGKDE